MLLSNGQGGTVDPLVDLFPFLGLKGVQPFPGIAHPRHARGTEGEVLGTGLHTCLARPSGTTRWLHPVPSGEQVRLSTQPQPAWRFLDSRGAQCFIRLSPLGLLSYPLLCAPARFPVFQVFSNHFADE